MADGDNFLWKIYGGSSRQGANVQILLRVLGGGGGGVGGGRVTNTFSSNLKTVNLNTFPNYGGI